MFYVFKSMAEVVRDMRVAAPWWSFVVVGVVAVDSHLKTTLHTGAERVPFITKRLRAKN